MSGILNQGNTGSHKFTTSQSGALRGQNSLTMGRIKEFQEYRYASELSTTALGETRLVIFGGNYIALTPEHTTDTLEFSLSMNMFQNENYVGWGIDYSTDSTFSSPTGTTVWGSGRHTHGRGNTDLIYYHFGATILENCATLSLAANTKYYFRPIGQSHADQSATMRWGAGPWTGETNGIGIHFSGKRWSIV